MRFTNLAFVVSLGIAVACSSDRAIAPTPPTPPPRFSTSVDLSGSGSTRVYQSIALAINDSGTIVGYAQATANDRWRAALWQAPDYKVAFLPDLGVGSSVAVSIGNDGTIGGRICEDASTTYPCHPSYWRDGTLHQLGGIGQVNDVCGCDGHTLVGHLLVDGADHGIIWEDDIPIDVGFPDDRPSVNLVAVAHGNIIATVYDGVAEGDTAYQTQRRPYRWSPSAGWVSLGFEEFGIYDVNSRGSVVGGLSVLWLDGSNTPIGIPGEGLPYRISDHDVVGGECVLNPPGTNADFLPCEWTATTGWYAVSNDHSGSFEGLNNLNDAVGYSDESGRSVARLWKP